MARDPYDGEGTEKEIEESLWPSMAPASSTGASVLARGRTAASMPAPDMNTQSVASASGAIPLWSFPYIYSLPPPMTPMSHYLLQDDPSTPLAYDDSWCSATTPTVAPTYSSSAFSNTDQMRSMSFTERLYERINNESASVSSYSSELSSMLRPSLPGTGAFTMSATSSTYFSPSASSTGELKREQQEETGSASAPHKVGYLYEVTANPSSSSSSDDAGQREETQFVSEEGGRTRNPRAGLEAATDVIVQQIDQKSRVLAGAHMVEETQSPSSGQDHTSADKEAPPETTSSKKPPLGKAKKKGQKRHREARVALITQSEVEHLEDGFRWRKYGQKAVKNSPYPRSYFRCTNSNCSVKKRVERSPLDRSLVITTYEGQHNHHSPAVLRGSADSHVYAAAAAAAATFNLQQQGAGPGPFSFPSPVPAPSSDLSIDPSAHFSFSLPRSTYELPNIPMQLLQALPPPLLSSFSPSLLTSPLFSSPSPSLRTPSTAPDPTAGTATFPTSNLPYPALPSPSSPTRIFFNPSAISPPSDPFSHGPPANPPAADDDTQQQQQQQSQSRFGALFPPKR